ncbi:MAG: DUF4276 family protein [Prevotella sp.]|nr:DUF4276 family protein [Prevotella sp.]
MKRLYIIVEGQTEQEFVNSMIAPYLQQFGIYSVTPILIRTSKSGRGGFVNYEHLKNDAVKLLRSQKDDFIVSMFVDFFRIPEIPQKEKWEKMANHKDQVAEMEKCIKDDIKDHRFIPYIQLHEFEALLFSSNKGFETYFTKENALETHQIINAFENPEEINSTPEGAPSKRLMSIKNDYEKVLEGNLIALVVGMKEIMAKCPRFKAWIEELIKACK